MVKKIKIKIKTTAHRFSKAQGLEKHKIFQRKYPNSIYLMIDNSKAQFKRKKK